MSRHWSERKYINSDSLWSFIDEYAARLDILAQHDSVESSELCKLLILGRREMLDALGEYLSEYEAFLSNILTDHHGVFTKEELEELIKKEYHDE